MNIDIRDGNNMETKANESFDNGDFSISKKSEQVRFLCEANIFILRN
jgi:hypothetical protein